MPQTVIITGAASGIGRAVASELAAKEPTSMLLADRDSAGLDDVAAALRRSGSEVVTCAADLAAPEESDRIIEIARRHFGKLDALVSNAGIIQNAPLLDLEVADFDRIFAVNLRPTWLLARAAHDMLRESRGAVVATASIASENPTPPLGAYAASKAALVMLVSQMAMEWGSDGIRCNCVSPGPTYTNLTKNAYMDDAVRRQREAGIPLGRLGVPEDIAHAILFLISKESSFITGVNLMVDGGMTRNLMLLSGTGKMGRAVE